MEQQDRASTSFKEIVWRVVNAEAKAGLRSSPMVFDSNAWCFRGHRPSHNNSPKMQTQGTTAKKPRTKKLRPKKVKQADGKTPALPCSKEPVKPNCQEKKKQYRMKKQDRKNSSPVTEDNAIEGKKGDGKCYNCQKKDYIARNCPELPKN